MPLRLSILLLSVCVLPLLTACVAAAAMVNEEAMQLVGKPSTNPVGVENPFLPGSVSSSLPVDQPSEHVVLVSPSGQYQLRVEEGGNLVLVDRWHSDTIFSSDSAVDLANVVWNAYLTPKAVLEVRWHRAGESAATTQGVMWSSNLLADCAPSNDPSPDSTLELLDSGLLYIRSGGRSICTIHRLVKAPGQRYVDESQLLQRVAVFLFVLGIFISERYVRRRWRLPNLWFLPSALVPRNS